MKDRSAEVLSPRLLEEIGGIAATRAYAKNAIIVSEGDETDSLYVLLSGRVKVFLSDAQGKEVTLNQLGPGEYFGEITLDGGVRSASVMALQDTRCAVVKRGELLALMDVYGRVARLLLELAEEEDGRLVIREALTHKEIASRVGASREMISRIFSDLNDGGYLRKENGRLVIVRRPPPRW